MCELEKLSCKCDERKTDTHETMIPWRLTNREKS